MGHQWYDALAGETAKALRFELDKELPDRTVASDLAAKFVHNRVIQLVAASDLTHLVAAVEGAIRTLRPGVSMLDLRLAITQNLSVDCIYRDESMRVAFVLAKIVLREQRCTMVEGIRAAAEFFAHQICHAEGIQRLPRDGLLGAHDLVEDLSVRTRTKVGGRLVNYYQKDPKGWRDHVWKAPRAQAKRRTTEELESESDL